MNWLTKAISLGEKIKKVLRKRPSKEEIENSDWTSCCKGPILKKDLEKNLWVCNSCGKHHRISCRQRFDIFFGKNSYEIIDTKRKISPLIMTKNAVLVDTTKLSLKQMEAKLINLVKNSINNKYGNL